MIDYVFYLCVDILVWLAKLTGTTYVVRPKWDQKIIHVAQLDTYQNFVHQKTSND